jgi:excisionase family DNA binding protein
MTKPAIESPYLTMEEAAEYLRYPSTRWFRVQVKKLGIPYLRRGRRKFFTKTQLDEFMHVANDATGPSRRTRGKNRKAA